MAFLDNSGDIILDAVLTDTGRKRLARGDGTFRIVKFALSDEEINYGTYDGTLPSGQEALEIMQTPILEAFTNNTSMMHSFLQTYTDNENLLYLPVLKLNTQTIGTNINSQFNSFLVAVDLNTSCGLTITGGWGTPTGPSTVSNGIWYGYDPSQIKTNCRIDQGIDNALVPPASNAVSSEMYENQYRVELDGRFGQLISQDGATLAIPSFTDDDGIDVYYFSSTGDPMFVKDNSSTVNNTTSTQTIAGWRGSMFEFQIQASIQLQTTTSLFTKLGGEFDAAKTGSPAVDSYFIDSIVRVTGMTTGYTIDVPVRYVRAQGSYNCTP
jgi:hypothetical protein